MLSEKVKEHKLKYTPMEEVYGQMKKQEEGERNKKVFTKHSRKGQAGGARQTLTQAHAGGVSFTSAAPQCHLTQCLLHNRHLVYACQLNGN